MKPELVHKVKAYAKGKWTDIFMRLTGLPAEILDGKHHPCPKCGGKDRFRFIDQEEGALFCNQCFNRNNGDGIAAVQWLLSCSFAEAVGRIAEALGIELEEIEPAGYRQQLVFQPWRPALLQGFFKRYPSITEEALLKNGAQLAIWRKNNLVLAIPIFDATRPHRMKTCGYVLYSADGAALQLENSKTKILTAKGSKAGWIGKDALQRLKQAETIIRTEGPSDMLAVWGWIPPALKEKIITLTWSAGAALPKRRAPTICQIFTNKHVIIIGDNDKNNVGQAAAKEWASIICQKSKSLKLYIPETIGYDIRDEIEDGLRFQQFLQRLDNIPFFESQPTREKPEIIITDFEQTVNATKQAIQKINQPEPWIFYRPGINRPVALIEDAAGARLQQLEQMEWRSLLQQNLQFKQFKSDFKIERPPPRDVVEATWTWPQSFLPPIEKLIFTPIVLQNGEIKLQRGYDQRARSYALLKFDVNLPEKIRPEQAAEAKEFIERELFNDFPFTSEADKTNTIAALLLPFLRDLIDGPTPLHLIDSPTPGTGKTLLANVIAAIVTGRPAAAQPFPRDEESLRKLILAKLIRCEPIVVLDNMPTGRKANSESLAAAITAQRWSDRILGASQIVEIPNSALWIVTANNAQLSLELARRTLRIRLDAGIEMPWRRDPSKFRHPDLIAWTLKNRSRILYQICVLIQFGLQNRDQTAPRALGGFESWSQKLSSVLLPNGWTAFLSGAEEEIWTEAAEAEQAEMADFVQIWFQNFAQRAVNASELAALAKEHGYMERALKRKESARARAIAIGIVLNRFKDRIFSVRDPVVGTVRVRLCKSQPRGGKTLWSLKLEEL